jgi:hypothetical protein
MTVSSSSLHIWERNEASSYSTYLKFGNERENLMEKGVFLGVPKNPIFVGLRRIFFGRSHYE